MPAATTSVQLAWTNKADWTVQIQVNDADTGDLIDLTGAEINVRVIDDQRCQRLNATVGDGVSIIDTGIFQFEFSADQMKGLLPGSYQVGCVALVGGVTLQIFVGTVSIIDGIAEL